jgi:hypothetical protein
VGIGVFSVLVGTFTVVCSVQICLQVWAPQVRPLAVDCATGTLALVESVLEARSAASREIDERQALARFRSAVEAAWSTRPALGETCASDDVATNHLRAIDRLRYAEEHAVRYRAADLSRRRHAVQSLMPALLESARASQR